MRHIRQTLFVVGVATLAVHAAVVTLGALRVCWGVEHAHADAAAQDCPMHHHAVSHASQPAHHDHASSASEPKNDSARITCDCSNDPPSIYLGATALVPAPVQMAPSMPIVTLARQSEPSLAELWFPPFSPPPRSTSFQFS